MPGKPNAKAAKKKGLSDEEKQVKTLEYLHQVLEPTTVKDLIKVLPKAKGIPFNTVEEAVKMLVADNLAVLDKVGIQTLCWSFPATAGAQKQSALGRRQAAVAALQEKVAHAEETLARLKRDRGGAGGSSEERAGKMARYEALQAEDAALRVESAAVDEFSEASVEELAAEARTAIAQANLWTDNIFILAEHAARARDVSTAAILKEFEIPENLSFLGG
ncbi:Meiotic nuclear division protein 1-like protein [Diplonema papillatum]|nr:Meiotic nuclear division protein 1-like protein [Diplonema papillatum]